MPDVVMVQVRFSVERDGHTLNDAVYFPLDEYVAMDEPGRIDAIQAVKDARFDAWRAVVAEAAKQVAPVESEEVLAAQAVELVARLEKVQEDLGRVRDTLRLDAGAVDVRAAEDAAVTR